VSLVARDVIDLEEEDAGSVLVVAVW
jgi:hypothetical protein